MKNNTFLFILVFGWLILLTYGYVHVQGSIMFILEELGDVYGMISDIYKHITNLLNMEVSL